MSTEKTYLIEKLKFKTANLIAGIILIFDHVLAVMFFFVPIPEPNKSTFNTLVSIILLPCTAGSLYYLFQYLKKNAEN